MSKFVAGREELVERAAIARAFHARRGGGALARCKEYLAASNLGWNDLPHSKIAGSRNLSRIW